MNNQIEQISANYHQARIAQSVLNSGLSIGEQIWYVRKHRGLTQQALCDKIGMAQTQLARYENDVTKPRKETLIKIARALDCGVKFPTNSEPVLILKEYRALEDDNAKAELIQIIGKLNPRDVKWLLDIAKELIERFEEGRD